jgi:hypothetical protein
MFGLQRLLRLQLRLHRLRWLLQLLQLLLLLCLRLQQLLLLEVWFCSASPGAVKAAIMAYPAMNQHIPEPLGNR